MKTLVKEAFLERRVCIVGESEDIVIRGLGRSPVVVMGYKLVAEVGCRCRKS